MTLEEAQHNLGKAVGYQAYAGATLEHGIIVHATSRWVFVRYGADIGAKATDASQLVLLVPAVK